nr:uroporphyrinogen decarboxylase family protein [Oscillatoria laete-virens]
MTDRVPRTEYSVEWYHTDLVKLVTGIDPLASEQQVKPDQVEHTSLGVNSSVDTQNVDNRMRAMKEFMRKWDYAIQWATPTGAGELAKRGRVTKMGHASYDGHDGDIDRNVGCPFKTVEEALNFDPAKEYGAVDEEALVKEFNAHWAKWNGYWKDCTLTMGGVYITLFSGLIEIFGWDMLLLAMGEDSKKFTKVVDSYAEWIAQFYRAWGKSDAPVIMSHDDICWTSGPVASPAWYRQNIFPHYKKLWAPLLEADKKLIFTSDGKYDMFFDDIVECGARTLVMEPCSDMASFAKKYGKTHGFIGNADTRILLRGNRDEIRAEVKRCMDIGRDCPGFIMAVGNHIPANTPIDSCLWYQEAYLEMSVPVVFGGMAHFPAQMIRAG